ncbi:MULTISPECIES: VOC family protein [Amycolatopsis]|uniref:Glyoxalase-like domain-containing protein n=1 Tax=Amycolatopsis tucumanensis TaxID=401106 RepID=A0ABP7HQX8_9PSEU|nr:MULTISPECIES: VOC family protein [Amycolatopsis]MCF6421365.1 glyoxalase [Amycolatopsis tucumanensis]
MSGKSVRFCVLPVSDVAASAAFYAALGCTERGVDGNRWAGLASEYVALSLCGPADPKRPSRPAFAVVVDDVPAALAEALEAGGRVLSGTEGADVQLTDPDGNHVMLIERRADGSG